MPPCTCNESDATRTAAFDAAAFATDAASGNASGSLSAAHAAYSVTARAFSVSSSIRAQRCETPWKVPILRPNCSRSPA